MQIKSLFRNYNVHFQKFNFNKINNKDVYIIDKNVHDLFFKKFNIKKKSLFFQMRHRNLSKKYLIYSKIFYIIKLIEKLKLM